MSSNSVPLRGLTKTLSFLVILGAIGSFFVVYAPVPAYADGTNSNDTTVTPPPPVSGTHSAFTADNTAGWSASTTEFVSRDREPVTCSVQATVIRAILWARMKYMSRVKSPTVSR